MGEQILAQIGDDALADPLQNDRLKIGACHREHQNPRIDRDRSEQAAEGKIGGDKFFDRTDDQGRDNVVSDGEEHQEENQKKLGPVRFGIGEQAAQNLAVCHGALKTHGGLFIFD